MAPDLETVISKAKAYAEDAKRTLPIEKVVLYGSYAKGTADERSDIDICFFMGSFGDKTRLQFVQELHSIIGEKHRGNYFSPNAFEMDDIPRDEPFVKEVLRTGIEIYSDKEALAKREALGTTVLPMSLEEKADIWFQAAKDDLEDAQVNTRLLKRFRYTGFLCHQAIIRLAKCLYTLYVDDVDPHTSDISAVLAPMQDRLSAALRGKSEFFGYLAKFYKRHKESWNEDLDEAEALGILSQTEEVFAWLLTLKP